MKSWLIGRRRLFLTKGRVWVAESLDSISLNPRFKVAPLFSPLRGFQTEEPDQ